MPGKLVNKSDLAAVFGVSQQTLTRWQKEGMPHVAAEGKGDENEYDTAECIAWWGKRELRNHGKFDLNDEKAKLAREQTEHAKRRNELQKGNVIKISELREVLQRLCGGLRQKIISSGMSKAEKNALLEDIQAMKQADYGADADDEDTEQPATES